MNFEPSLPKLVGSDVPAMPASRIDGFSHSRILASTIRSPSPVTCRPFGLCMPVVGIETVAGEREHERQVRTDLDLVGDPVRAGELHLGHRRHDLIARGPDLRTVLDRVVDRERVRQERDERVERELVHVGDASRCRPRRTSWGRSRS